MLGIGSTELVIILVFGFLLFGPDKLPQMGRTIGRALRQFRETQEKLTAVVQTEVVDPMAAAAKKPVVATGAAAAEDDSDADAAPAEPAAPVRKETFAERRARLAAERAEAEAAKAASDAEGGSGDAPLVEGSVVMPAAESAEDQVDEDRAAAPVEPAAEPAAEAEAEAPAEPAELTTEDLYARRPRRRKAAAANADAAEEPSCDQPADTSKGGEQ